MHDLTNLDQNIYVNIYSHLWILYIKNWDGW